MSSRSSRFLGYTLVGAIGTVVHYVVLITGVDELGLAPVVASSLGAVAGTVTNYFLNYRVTFRSRKAHGDAMLKFVLVAAAGIGINGLVVDASLRIDGVHYLSAQVIATAVVLVLGYLANRHWTFKEP